MVVCSCWLFVATAVVARVSTPRPVVPWRPSARGLVAGRCTSSFPSHGGGTQRLQQKSVSSQALLPEGGRECGSKRRSWATCPPSW